jgi:hypothetical protein
MLMKKLLSGLLITVLLLSISGPTALAETKSATEQPAEKAEVNKAAADNRATALLGKESLEKVISIAKERLVIPDEYKEFSSDVYNDGGKTIFRLRWYSSNDYYSMPGGGSLEVNVDENGSIIGYYHYIYNQNYENLKKIPKVDKNQALESARKFVSTLCPDLLGKLVFGAEKRNYSIDYEGNYNFTFYLSTKMCHFIIITYRFRLTAEPGIS